MELKAIRTMRGLTQAEVAEYLGCTPSVYSRYETGYREPSIDMLIKLANCFDVSLDDLLGRKEAPQGILTPYELELLSAARAADERAKRDALLLLKAHYETDNCQTP